MSSRRLTNVKFLGKVPIEQLLYLYANCSAVLSLGLHESSSLVVREGAVFGKPIICSDIAPNLEVQALLNVVTFESRNAMDLFSKLELVASALPSLLAAAAGNRQRVKALAWDRVAQDYVDVIRTILVR